MAGRYDGRSSNSGKSFQYQVFLSFRGEDIRKTFIDHLYHALVWAGVNVFRDNEGLERGNDIQATLYEAIEMSQLSIVTFSSGYATSHWCLDELVKITECRSSAGHSVFPVFYNVDSTTVRNQLGPYKEAFDAHEVFYWDDLVRVKKWRKALREVANLAGFPLQNQADGYEGQFIQLIIKEVMRKLEKPLLNVPRYIVGVDCHLVKINEWLQDGSPDVGVGVIHGMGGVGKTTIAKLVYNSNIDKFEGCSFLEDIRRLSGQQNGFVRLLRQLTSDISTSKVKKIYNVAAGMMKVREVIRCKKILLVLDDVDDPDQLHALLDNPDWFHIGSKILITTRNDKLCNLRMFRQRFKVDELDDDNSVELFSLHAFDQNNPSGHFIDVSKKLVRYCQGLPVALCVLASSLQNERDIEVWDSKLVKLEKSLDPKIQEVLKLSFHSIKDEDDRQLFLHIAFFFAGTHRDYATKILEGCDVYTKDGLNNLMTRCLVTVGYHGNLTMHPLIQEMAREVVRQEDDEPGRRSRLSDHKDTWTVLQNNKGTAKIKGIRLDFPDPDSSAFTPHAPKRARLTPFPTSSRRVSENPRVIRTDAFAKMDGLCLLEFNYVQLEGDYENFPKALKWLWWQGFPLDSIPLDLDLCQLVVLDMQNSHLVHAWEGSKYLEDLRILNLSGSQWLVETPDFSQAPRIELIVLESCVSLVKIHDSIGKLQRLTSLNLRGCRRLKELPISMNKHCSIEVLDLSYCSGLFKNIYHLSSELSLSTGSICVPKSALTHFWDPPIAYFPVLPFLKTLILANCGISGDAIFDYLGCASFLEHLDLSGNPIRVIHKFMGQFTWPSGWSLYLKNCTNLESVSHLPRNGYVNVNNCPLLESLSYVQETEFPVSIDFQAKQDGKCKMEDLKSMVASRATFMGYSDLSSSGTSSCAISKGIYEGGLFNVFLDGNHITNWFTTIIPITYSFLTTNLGYEQYVTVPGSLNRAIRGFNMAWVLSCVNNSQRLGPFKLEIRNLSSLWYCVYYTPHHTNYPTDWCPMENRDGTWLAHWSAMENREVRPGDVLQVTIWKYKGPLVPVKFGIQFIYEDDLDKEKEEEDYLYSLKTSGACCEQMLNKSITAQDKLVEEGEEDCDPCWYHKRLRDIDLSEFELTGKPREYHIGWTDYWR